MLLAKRIALAAVTLLLSLELSLQCASLVAHHTGALRSTRPASADGIRILCVGDSHTWGTGVERHEAYPAQLQRLLRERLARDDIEVINMGVPGVGSGYVAAHLRSQIESIRPNFVLVWVGINNLWNRLDDTAQNHRRFAARLETGLLHIKLYRLARVLWSTHAEAGDQAVGPLEIGPFPAGRKVINNTGAKRRRDIDAALILSSDLRIIFTLARSLDIPVIVATYPLALSAPIDAAIEGAAAEHHVPVIRTRRDFARASARGATIDQLIIYAAGPHPSPLLYEYIAESMAQLVIKRLEID